MAKCKNCGKETLLGYEYCPQCAAAHRSPIQDRHSRNRTQFRGQGGLPESCIFKESFFDDDGYLKRDVSMEASERMARLLENEGMTQTSIRNLFNMIKNADMRLKSDPDLPLGFVREQYSKFVTQTEYQFKRGIVKKNFRDFVVAHEGMAIRNRKEFQGFVDYFAAIVARIKIKKY